MRKIDAMNGLCVRFCDGFPHKLEGVRRVAEEIENPVINLAGEAESWQQEFNLLAQTDGVVQVSRYRLRLPNGDEIMPEASWSTMELATKPYTSLYQLDAAAKQAMGDMAQLAAVRGKLIMGYGIQPTSHESDVPWVDHPRYGILRRSLGGCVDKMTIATSQQVQVNVTAREAVPAVNILCELSGLITAICCHSPIWYGRPGPYRAFRELAWRGIDPRRVGIPKQRFYELEDYFGFLVNMPMVFVKQDDAYYLESRTLKQYLLNGAPVKQFDDLFRSQETTVWPVARLRWRDEGCCTVEYRGACTQKPGDRSVAALVLGLIESLDEAKKLAAKLSWEDWRQVREAAIRSGLHFLVPTKLGVDGIDACRELLRISRQGLSRRSLGEEVFLEDVERRLRDKKAPADQALEDYRTGGQHRFIERRVYGVTTQ